MMLFALALVPRLLPPPGFITWDELNWTYRALQFGVAMGEVDFARTFQTGHPGVVTMELGALALTPAHPDPTWVRSLPPFDEDNLQLVRELAPWLPLARPAVAVAVAGLIVLTYLTLWPVIGQLAALVASGLLSFDPFDLAHSRVLHLDAILTGAMFLAVTALFAYCTTSQRRYWILSGVMAGLAVLEKSTGLFVVGFGLMILSAWVLVHRRVDRSGEPERGLRDRWVIPGWFAIFTSTIWILWPALWIAPGMTAAGLLARAGEAVGGREVVFFLGERLSNPGIWFYPTVAAFRLTPVTLLGLGLSLIAAIDGPRRKVSLGFLAYVLLFTLFMTLGKKFDRYLLPLFPALDALAALGYAWAGTRFAKRPALVASLALVPLLVQAATSLPYGPYVLSYYNPLLGGTARAVQSLPVGWGEGLDQVAAYLEQHLPPGSTVATASLPLLAPLYPGPVVPLRDKPLQSADYALLYLDDVQIGRPVWVERLKTAGRPVWVLTLWGADYAWLYQKPFPDVAGNSP
jgi:4-amino-4-deoxy-L-arabinose transferase-like glycosyltransferase